MAGADISDVDLGGNSQNAVYYFSGSTPLGAKRGYNHKSSGNYSQDFMAIEFNFSAQNLCAD